MYLNALCCKKLGMIEKANEVYMELTRMVQMDESKVLIMSTWGLLLAPMMSNRDIIFKSIEKLQLMIEYYDIKPTNDITYKFYDYKQN